MNKILVLGDTHFDYFKKFSIFEVIKYKNMTKKLTTKDFIEKAKKVHGDKYDYSKVNYERSTIKVCIICLEHGEFW